MEIHVHTQVLHSHTHTHTHRVPEIEGNQSIHILNLRILYNSIKYLKKCFIEVDLQCVNFYCIAK